MATTYTQKDIEQVTSLSIVNVVESLGYKLSKTGKHYSHGKNQKLRIYPETNSYYNFSTGQGGNTINFVRRQLDTTFQKAMDYLLEGNYSEAEHVELVKEPFNYYFPHNADTHVGKDYLINKRKLDPTLVNFLFDKQKIRMDKLNQIIFPWQKNNVIVGATVQGTTYNPEKYPRDYFKGIARNSESNFTYTISIGQPKKMYVFESPIDLLSYWSMNKGLKDVTFASLNGSKDAAVFNTLSYLETNNCKVRDIYICSDNDRVGQILFQKVDLGFKNIQVHKEIPDDLMIPKECIDLYQEVLNEKQSAVGIELIAAIHKIETNLSRTNECTSKEDLVFYFAERLKSDEKSSIYTQEELKQRIEQLVDDLEQGKVDGEFTIRETLIHRMKETLPDETLNERTLLRIEETIKTYQEMDELLIGTPVKDWNEKLQQEAELLEKKQFSTRPTKATKNQSTIQSNEKAPTQISQKSLLIDKTFINEERQQQIRMTGTEDVVQADIFQTGQYAGSLEPSNPQEMEKLIHSYGFMAIDKEDYAKYTQEKQQHQMKQEEIELVMD